MRRYMKRFLTLLLTASMIMGSFGMDAASAAYGADAVNAAANISETEESSTGADRSLPSFSDLYIGENAISFEYATGETERMASDLGYDMALQQKKENVSSEKKIISRFFALGAEEPKPDYEFADMYYLYDTATSTATNENLTGDASDAAQTVKMQMEIAANVQYDPGTLEIRIPSSLYTYRDGNTTAYFSDLGVPKAPKTNKNTAFNYMLKNIDGKEYIVLKNAKTLLEGSSNMIQIFYSLNDMQTVDQTSWSWTPEIYVDGVKDADGTTLTGIMDTSTSLSKTKKNGFILSGSLIYPELYTVKQIDNWLVKCGTSFENTGSKLDDYRYVLWRTDIAGSDSQPWTLSVKDTPASGGIVLGQCVTDIYNNVLAKSGTASDGTLTWANQQSYNLGKAAYIYSVTAYPLTSWPDDNKVSNTISVTVTGTDDKVDHTLSSSSDWVWEKYEWTYVGDGLYRNKDLTSSPYRNSGAAWINVYELNKAKGKDTELPDTWRSYGFMRGYSLTGNLNADGITYDGTKSYKLITADDIQLIKSDKESYQNMDYGDYYYTSLQITAGDHAIDVYENVTSRQSEGDVQSIYVMTADSPNAWVKVADVPYAQCNPYTFTDEWLSQKIFRVKVEHTSNDYDTYCYITGKTVLRGDSEKVAALLSNQEATTLTVENLMGDICTYTDDNSLGAANMAGSIRSLQGAGGTTHVIQDDGTQYTQYPSKLDIADQTKTMFDGYLLTRDNETQTVKRINEINGVNKSATGKNDADNARVDLTYTLTGYDGYEIYSRDTANELAANGINVSRTTAKFFDLLPVGVSFDPSAAVKAGQISNTNVAGQSGSWDVTGITVETKLTDNYQNSGRQMVEFDLTYSGVDNSKIDTDTYGQFYRWFSGFGVQFGAYYAWKNEAIANNAENACAYLTENLKGTHYADDGANAPDSVRGYFRDLDGDGDTTESVLYAVTRVNVNSAKSAEAQVTKSVKADDNAYGEESLDTQVEVGRNYSYTVRLTTTSNQYKKVILYDRLEDAPAIVAADPDTKDPRKDTFASNYWRGTFTGVDTAALAKLGVAPVVYYSEDRTAAYDLTDANAKWTEASVYAADHNNDLSAVKAVAVDTGKTTSGTDFVLPAESSMYFKIRMKAPAVLQDRPSGNTASADPGKTSVYAYNNSYYIGTPIYTDGKEGSATKGTADSTSVSLYEKSQLVLEKTAVTGVGADQDTEFDFLVYVYDASLLMNEATDYADYAYASRTYTLMQKNADGQWEEVSGIHATDAEGRLTLKLGQRAIFNDVATVNYRIVEDTDINWVASNVNNVKVTTSSNTAAGKLAVGENDVTFQNLYKSMFYFSKTTQFTTPHTNPDDEFTFILKLNGKALADTAYYKVDPLASMGANPAIEETLKTDQYGRFKIKAGERVAFLTDDGDQYTVTEVAGFGDGTDWLCPTPEVTGTVRAPYSSNSIMNNYRYKDMTVTKTITFKNNGGLSDDDRAHEFIYTLTVAGTPWANGAYVLTDAAGTQTDGKTEEDGTFKLKYGETIVLKKLPAGAKYVVTEKADPDYPFVSPENGVSEGTISKTAPTGATVVFTNTKKERDLAVMKSVTYAAKDETAALAAEFPFTIKVNGATLSDAPYNINSSSYNPDASGTPGTTDGNGGFKLKSGQYIWFKDRSIGDTYEITELPSADGTYTCTTPADGKVTGTIGSTTSPTLVNFTNQYGKQSVLEISKQYTFDDSIPENSRNNIKQYYSINVMLKLFDEDGETPYSGENLSLKWTGYNGDGSVYGPNSFTYAGGSSQSYGLWMRGEGHISISGIPEGIVYQITEYNTDYWGWGNGSLIVTNVTPGEGQPLTGTKSGETDKETLINHVESSMNAYIVKALDDVELYVGYTKEDIAVNPTLSALTDAVLGKKLLFRLMKRNASGAYEPAAGYTYQYATPAWWSGISLTFGDPMTTDADGTMTMVPQYFPKNGSECLGGLCIKLHIPAEFDDNGNIIPVDMSGENGAPYKVIEVPEESDEAFGVLGYQGYYTDQWMGSILSFNNYINRTKKVTVTKHVTTETGETAPGAEFSYTLYRIPIKEVSEQTNNIYSDSWELDNEKKAVLSNTAYTITENGTEGTTVYHTDADGKFKLKDGQTANFTVPGAGKSGNWWIGTVYSAVEDVASMPTGFSVVGNAAQYAGRYNSSLDYSNYTDDMVFTNKYGTSPDLTVRKVVTNESGQTAPQNDEFTFTVKVADEAYRKQEYTKYASDGTKILNYETVNGTQTEVPWTTDRYGRFTLKAGQSATFSWVGAGKKYEITEDAKQNYTQVSPAAGSAANGNVAGMGSTETFTNHYGKKPAALTVRETLSYPAGYDMPDVTFTFNVKTGDDTASLANYGLQSYIVYNADGTQAGAGTTDSDGNFTLKPGQYAVFKNISVDQEFKVTQIIPSGASYRLIESDGTSGTMSADGATANFTNAAASFLVKKNVSASGNLTAPSGDAFTFTASADGRLLANTKYLVYDRRGAYKESRTTDAFGQFTLTYAEAAMFMGLPDGTSVNVRESAKTNYTQVFPDSAEGYTDTTGDNVISMTFENNYEKFTAVRVTKEVTAPAGTAAPTGTDFTFTIRKDGAAAASEIYMVGSGSFKTDVNGQFKLKNGESAYFKKMLVGTVVDVEETSVPDNYSATAASGSATVVSGNESVITLKNAYWSGVVYEWAGTVPPDVTLPKDSSRYPDGKVLTVDKNYTKGETVSGTYNGRSGRYVFNGWKVKDGCSTVLNTDGTFTTAIAHDAEFVGTWTFIEDETVLKGYAVTLHKSCDVDSATVVGPGYQLTYSLEAVNSGSEPAPYTTVRDYIPTGTTYVDKSATDRGVYVPAANGTAAYVEWVIDNIAAGSSETVSFTVSVNDDAAGRITNTAKYDSGTENPGTPGRITSEPTKESNRITHTLNGTDPVPAAVEVIKTASPSSAETVKENQTITYALEVKNNGGSTANDICVRDYIPAGTTYFSVTDGSFNKDQGYAEWTVSKLSAGESRKLEFAVTVNAPANGMTIRNQALYEADHSVNNPAGKDPSNTTNIVEHITEVTGETAVISVTKKWTGYANADQPKSVQAVLKKNGTIVETVTLSADNQWTYVWMDMPVYATSSNAEAYGTVKTVVSSTATASDAVETESTAASYSVTAATGSDAVKASSSDAGYDDDGVLLDGKVGGNGAAGLTAAKTTAASHEVKLTVIEWTVEEVGKYTGYNTTIEKNQYAFTIVNDYTVKRNPESGPSGGGSGSSNAGKHAVTPPAVPQDLHTVAGLGDVDPQLTMYGFNPDGTPSGFMLTGMGLPKTGEEERKDILFLILTGFTVLAALLLAAFKRRTE